MLTRNLLGKSGKDMYDAAESLAREAFDMAGSPEANEELRKAFRVATKWNAGSI